MAEENTTKKDDLPVFPDIMPDSIERSQRYELIAEDFEEEIIPDLLSLMYHHPESYFFLYLQHNGTSINSLSANGILSNKTESFYYRHPKFDRDFIRIKEPYSWDWQKEVVEQGPMYFKVTLTLSEGKRKEIDRNLIVKELKQSDTSPFLFNPSIYGMGIKGPQLWKWLKKTLG